MCGAIIATIASAAPALAGDIAPYTEEAVARGIVMQGITFPPQTGFYGFGCGFSDLDNDGDPDVVVLTNDALRVGIFENVGGTFIDRTLTCGIPSLDSPSSFAAGDYDGDGDRDLFVTRVLKPSKLYRNDGNFQFVDVSVAAGILQVNRISKAASWTDYNNDGWIDLYVCNYRFAPGGPGASDNHLYRNNGNGTFTQLSASVGLNSDSPTLECVWTDYDNDGDLDVYLSNDRGVTPGDPGNEFFRNDGGVFTEIGASNGTQIQLDSMGLACGDFNRDGHIDFYMTNTTFDVPDPEWDFPLLLGGKRGNFVEAQDVWGVDQPSPDWGWGCSFFDWNNDGWLDLYVVNMFEPNSLFQNTGAPPTTNVAAAANITGSSGAKGAKYCAAVADVDGDGDLDMLNNDQGTAVTLHINHEGEKRSYVRFRVVGVWPNTGAIGASARIVAGGASQMQEIYAGGNGYLVQNEEIIHFGLGDATVVDSATIRWPSNGPTRQLTSVPASHTWLIWPPASLGDTDGDADFDFTDRAAIASSFGAVTPGEERFDLDGDFEVDAADLAAFRLKYEAAGFRWADLDGDGVVGGADLGLLLGAWGSANPLYDLDGDGLVLGSDLGIVLGGWG